MGKTYRGQSLQEVQMDIFCLSVYLFLLPANHVHMGWTKLTFQHKAEVPVSHVTAVWNKPQLLRSAQLTQHQQSP